MNDTITIRGREYKVEPGTDHVTAYVLTGSRGARLVATRNVNSGLLYTTNVKTPRSPAFVLTDTDGVLREAN